MKKQKPKTVGLEWLYLSMASFNGSGYADKTDEESYVASYRAYKQWRKEHEAVELLNQHLDEAIFFTESLIEAKEASHYLSEKNLAKFRKFYNPNTIVYLKQGQLL